MSGIRRKAILVSAAVVGGAMLMTGCQGSATATDTGAARGSSSATPAGDPATASGSPTAGSGQGADTGSDVKDKGSGQDGTGSGVDTGNGEREPVGQSCGANDISWSTKSETQAGGYILIIAKAKPGITCALPAALPTVAFGSDGTQAGPAEQAVGKQITLRGSVTAYAGVNPKSTGGDGGKELEHIIVGVGDDDPNPVSLRVGTITVQDPKVTNWHISPTDAVPFN
ncbi:DUF4232 domain-containing protein [Streptomyces albipurpureus]|uniref:DUF4232 domain-containing protein n=1 Tax=Streptomyces albipurpureus TaxID=2897419 RepID=A0ABT0UTM3_9ACTN|nr:DUF4232 domain-containing protein [Streptomyces sp. CWNU-1]MCM2391596.1 DUF4232 domain-containing protein [Streptomyces sp. CWNU-1]